MYFVREMTNFTNYNIENIRINLTSYGIVRDKRKLTVWNQVYDMYLRLENVTLVL